MKIYLAGPEVFLPDPISAGAHLKTICSENSAIGLFPMDNCVPPEIFNPPLNTSAPTIATWIRQKNMDMISSCDGIIANMTPFRGVSMDAGTAYEMGVAAALGKVVVGYSTDRRTYKEKVVEIGKESDWGPVREDINGLLRDGMTMAVEDFEGENLIDNLMMAKGIDNVEGVMLGSAEEAIKMAVRIWKDKKIVEGKGKQICRSTFTDITKDARKS